MNSLKVLIYVDLRLASLVLCSKRIAWLLSLASKKTRDYSSSISFSLITGCYLIATKSRMRAISEGPFSVFETSNATFLARRTRYKKYEMI